MDEILNRAIGEALLIRYVRQDFKIDEGEKHVSSWGDMIRGHRQGHIPAELSSQRKLSGIAWLRHSRPTLRGDS